ncbi:DUF5689 domain-containing protein [Aridibaculum aurantiacum]|uniref:DUF5689 domain-containing protein n=1 Tax=Aridibaculum aurantiacum TaxID=2810307 RepID=UPI001A95672B|nr:DUF5689 domain-containing protein [Aridibaculum aurantiacum]
MKNRFSLVGLASLLIVLATALAISSCKKRFDEPATFAPVNIDTNTTIRQLKNLSPSSGQLIEITNDVVFKGRVTANDRSGNIYKMIYLQDESAAIGIELDATGLYNQYPLGREVYVKAKGLYLVNEAGMLKLATRTVVQGTPTVSAIPSTLIDRYIVRGELKDRVEPVDVTLAQLDNLSQYQSMLIRLTDFEVANADLNKTFADTSANRATTNINFRNCSGGSIIVRSSGYANFAGIRVPQGRGTVTAIFTVFNTTKQLLIRDTTDVQLNGPRCGAANPNLQVKTIQEIRALYTGAPATIPANTGIEGIVVSNTANEAAGNYRIQDASGSGIQLRFTTAANPGAVLGDKLLVDLSGLTVELFNGDMQVNNVFSATKTGTGTITPRATTVAAINTNLAGSPSNNWASTVVTLSNVTISQVSTSGAGTNYSVTDATGSIISFVRTGLGITLPPAASSFTGYVSIFNGTPQITIRSAADVVAATTPEAAVTTAAVTGITQTAATSGGNVTYAGTTAVTARGVVWSTSQNPTVALSTKTVDGSGTGTFTSAITGLTANTTYYVRAYATNSSGTSYGNQVTFTTAAAGANVIENFETGAKTNYTDAAVALTTGSWFFTDGLLGTDANDLKAGAQSARLRGTATKDASIKMEFDVQGVQKVKFKFGGSTFNEGTDDAQEISVQLKYSKNGGTTWTTLAKKVGARGSLTATEYDIPATATENVRIEIVNTSFLRSTGNRLRVNIDDVELVK